MKSTATNLGFYCIRLNSVLCCVVKYCSHQLKIKNTKCRNLSSQVSRIFFWRKFIFDGGPKNYFSREFNFANYPYFLRNREKFFPWKFLPIKYLSLRTEYLIFFKGSQVVFRLQFSFLIRQMSFENSLSLLHFFC